MATNISIQTIAYFGYFLAFILALAFFRWNRKMDAYVQEEIKRGLEEAKNDHGLPILTFRGRYNDALELKDLCNQLLLFTDAFGNVTSGFRTKWILIQIRLLINKEAEDETV